MVAQMMQIMHHLRCNVYIGRRGGLRKEADYETRFRCAGRIGILREEVWVKGKCNGIHERHYIGEISPVPSRGYLATEV
jgi:hypothetical protein